MIQRVILTVKELASNLEDVSDRVLYALLKVGEAELWTDEQPRFQRVLSAPEVRQLQQRVHELRRKDCAFCRCALTEPWQVQFCSVLCEDDVTKAEPSSEERATNALLDEYFTGERTL